MYVLMNPHFPGLGIILFLSVFRSTSVVVTGSEWYKEGFSERWVNYVRTHYNIYCQNNNNAVDGHRMTAPTSDVYTGGSVGMGTYKGKKNGKSLTRQTVRLLFQLC